MFLIVLTINCVTIVWILKKLTRSYCGFRPSDIDFLSTMKWAINSNREVFLQESNDFIKFKRLKRFNQENILKGEMERLLRKNKFVISVGRRKKKENIF